MRPSTSMVTVLLLATCGALAACSSAAPGSSGAPGSSESSGPDGGTRSPAPTGSSKADAGLVDITGTWLLCDTDGETDETSIGTGGIVLRVTLRGGVADGAQLGGDGGAIYHPVEVNDAGTECTGDCGETDVQLGGPFDPATRVWSAGYYWPHGDATQNYYETYPARIVFSADGTRFTGVLSGDYGESALFGGRNDGAFSCLDPGGASSPSGSLKPSCHGTTYDCGSPPTCTPGCYLQISAVQGFPDTCQGSPVACSTNTDPTSCTQEPGCHWY